MSKKQVIPFRKTIAAATKDKIIVPIESDCTVDEIRVRFYAGQQNDFHVDPYILTNADQRENLVEYADGTNAYLSGDDDYLVFPIGIAVVKNSNLIIAYDNQDAVNAYTLVIDVILDYAFGTRRVQTGGAS